MNDYTYTALHTYVTYSICRLQSFYLYITNYETSIKRSESTFRIQVYINSAFGLVFNDVVPHSESGVVPMSSLLGVGQLGFWGTGKGGTIG